MLTSPTKVYISLTWPDHNAKAYGLVTLLHLVECAAFAKKKKKKIAHKPRVAIAISQCSN